MVMDQQQPEGLSKVAIELLKQHADTAANASLGDLLRAARSHLDQVRRVAADNTFVNVRLAQEICDRLHSVAAHWERLPAPARPWLKGAMSYFCDAFDDELDLSSPIGFEDDCEIMNACLRLARRDDLCLNPEGFDEY